MSTISDATAAELDDKGLIAVPKAEWNAIHERFDDLETDLAEHKDHTGREFADVRARITEIEEQNQQTEADSSDETSSKRTRKRPPQTSKPLSKRSARSPRNLPRAS